MTKAIFLSLPVILLIVGVLGWFHLETLAAGVGTFGILSAILIPSLSRLKDRLPAKQPARIIALTLVGAVLLMLCAATFIGLHFIALIVSEYRNLGVGGAVV